MNRSKTRGSIILAATAILAAIAACSSSRSTGEPANTTADAASDANVRTATTGTVERGEYLVDHVLVCGVCHTPNGPDGKPDRSKYLAGSRSYDFTDKDGTIVTVNAENLTSHNPEGLAAWSTSRFVPRSRRASTTRTSRSTRSCPIRSTRS